MKIPDLSNYRSIVKKLDDAAKVKAHADSVLFSQAAAYIRAFANAHLEDIAEIVRLRRLIESEADK